MKSKGFKFHTCSSHRTPLVHLLGEINFNAFIKVLLFMVFLNNLLVELVTTNKLFDHSYDDEVATYYFFQSIGSI